MDKYTQNTAYKKNGNKEKFHQKKNNIQRKERRHNTARIKENPMLTFANIRIHISSGYTIKFYKKEKKLSCLDMAVSRQTAKIEESLKSFL
jgi:hypothetical protein